MVYPLSSQERPIVLWAHKTQKGNMLLLGKAAERPSDQMAKLVEPPKPLVDADKIKVAEKDGSVLELKPNEILLFTNTHKDDDHPDRPDSGGTITTAAASFSRLRYRRGQKVVGTFSPFLDLANSNYSRSTLTGTAGMRHGPF